MSTNATPVEAAPTAKPASPDLVPVGPSTDTAADVVGVGELLDARAAPRVLASAPTAERTLVRLQRTAGNRAVVDYLGRSRRSRAAVQRQTAPEKPETAPAGARSAPPAQKPTAAPPALTPAAPEGEAADPNASDELNAAEGAETAPLAPTDITPEVAEHLAERYREIEEGGAVERDRAEDPLLQPEIVAAVRARAPGRFPDGFAVQRTVDHSAAPAHPVAQRQGAGSIPTIKFKYPLVARKRFKFSPIGMSLAGGYIKPAVTIDMPAIEGSAKPPPHLASDKEFTFEKGKGLVPRADILRYSDQVTSETVGTFKIEAKSGLELRKDKVELNAITVTFEGVEPDRFYQPELAFDLVNWEKGEWPMFLDFNFGATFYKKISTNIAGWGIEGKIALPVKVHLSVNEDKAAEWIVRKLGPRLVGALPAAAAIGAPLMAGAVCLALWIDAIETGKEIASSVDEAYFNSRDYANAFIATANGRDDSAGSEGARRGVTDANAVINRWKNSGLSPGLVDQIVAQHLPGQLSHATIMKQAWDRFSSQAIAEYRARHSVDAWCYDHGLPNDQRLLERVIRTVGSKIG
jgi:hypothetical protein